MKRLYEAVEFRGEKLFWDHRHHNSSKCLSYYHWHQCFELLFVHEGKGHVAINSAVYELRKGMLFFFRPYQLHHVYANVSPGQPYSRTILHFDPKFVDDLLHSFATSQRLYMDIWRGNTQVFDLFSCYESVVNFFDDYELARQSGHGELTEEIAVLFLRIFSRILQSSPDSGRAFAKSNERKSSDYALKAMQWIEEHYKYPFHLDELADALHISKFYLSRLFHEDTGSTLKAFITATRIRQACRLLETTMNSVEWIGNEVGIPNTSYFVRVFRQTIGTTPLKYRSGFLQSSSSTEEAK